MHAIGIGFVTGRKMNRPGQIARPAIATTIHQTADSAKDIAQRDAWGEHISPFPDRQFFNFRIYEISDNSSSEPAVINQAAMMNHKNLGDGPAGKLFPPI